ncbi:hypothetical protein T439DRAFT_352459 [Meredithblackwellia eburnea MCA 4105]
MDIPKAQAMLSVRIFLRPSILPLALTLRSPRSTEPDVSILLAKIPPIMLIQMYSVGAWVMAVLSSGLEDGWHQIGDSDFYQYGFPFKEGTGIPIHQVSHSNYHEAVVAGLFIQATKKKGNDLFTIQNSVHPFGHSKVTVDGKVPKIDLTKKQLVIHTIDVSVQAVKITENEHEAVTMFNRKEQSKEHPIEHEEKAIIMEKKCVSSNRPNPYGTEEFTYYKTLADRRSKSERNGSKFKRGKPFNYLQVPYAVPKETLKSNWGCFVEFRVDPEGHRDQPVYVVLKMEVVVNAKEGDERQTFASLNVFRFPAARPQSHGRLHSHVKRVGHFFGHGHHSAQGDSRTHHHDSYMTVDRKHRKIKDMPKGGGPTSKHGKHNKHSKHHTAE